MSKLYNPVMRIVEEDFTGIILPDPVSFDSDLYSKTFSESVVDDGVINLPTSTSGGFGFAQAGDGEEYILFSYTSAGAVTIISASANTDDEDTDTKFCIFDAGTNARIRNRLGSTKNVNAIIWYT